MDDDPSNFSSSSSRKSQLNHAYSTICYRRTFYGSHYLDRLPTVSASQALRKLASPQGRWISTGLPLLDASLRGLSLGVSGSENTTATGGLAKGSVTEIYGPPGSGKSALA